MTANVNGIDQRGQLLRAAVGFAGLPRPSYDRSLWALRTWLDSRSGIGRIAVGMAHQGYDLQLTQYDERGWRATFYTTGMEHSPTSVTTRCYMPRKPQTGFVEMRTPFREHTYFRKNGINRCRISLVYRACGDPGCSEEVLAAEPGHLRCINNGRSREQPTIVRNRHFHWSRSARGPGRVSSGIGIAPFQRSLGAGRFDG